MTISWINVNPSWQRQDVQAGLTIVVAILSAVAIFSFVQFIWQHGTTRVRVQDQASLASLLSVHTFGEAWDVLCLLRLKLFRRKHWMILLQCVIVSTFTLTALLSGPIARSATRRSIYQKRQDVTSWNVSRSFDMIAMAGWDWTNIANRLDNASFPLNVLLDELPDVKQDWKYRPIEWNFTWSVDCVPTTELPIVLYSTGQCTDIFTELPDLRKAIDPSQFDMNATDIKGYWTTSSPVYQHILGFLGGTTNVAKDDVTGVATKMKISIAALHMTNATKAPTGSACWFAADEKIPKSSYTRIDCSLTRSPDLSNRRQSAFPDTPDMTGLIQAYNQMYQARFMREGATNSSITMIKPRDLQRFYQTYMISKDSQQRKGHQKLMTVDVPITQISTAFIVCWSVITAACLAVAILSVRHYIRHIAAVTIPETKLEWMLQAIEMPEQDESEALIIHKKDSARARGKVRLSSAIHSDYEQPVQEGYQMRTPRHSTQGSVSSIDQRRSSVASSALYPRDSARHFEDAVFLLDRSHKTTRPAPRSAPPQPLNDDTAYFRQKQGHVYTDDRSRLSMHSSTFASPYSYPYSRFRPPATAYTSLNDNDNPSQRYSTHTELSPYTPSEPFPSPGLAMPRPQRHSWWRNKVLHPLNRSDGADGSSSISSDHDRVPLSPSLTTARGAGARGGVRNEYHDRDGGESVYVNSRISSLVEDDSEYYERGVGQRNIGRDFV